MVRIGPFFHGAWRNIELLEKPINFDWGPGGDFVFWSQKQSQELRKPHHAPCLSLGSSEDLEDYKQILNVSGGSFYSNINAYCKTGARFSQFPDV